MTMAMGNAPVKTMLRLRITAAAETAVRSGHPYWVLDKGDLVRPAHCRRAELRQSFAAGSR